VGVTTTRRAAALLAAAALVAGCGGRGTGAPPTVRVDIAGQQAVTLDPTQYCLDGDGQRYDVSPPVVEVQPDSAITLTVSDEVAEQGWSVQVFDQTLQQKIGDVAVPDGAATYTVGSSDVVPPTFYLVAVETSDRDACNGLSGAWPVGFIRAGEGTPSASPTTPPPSG
jgi:hypothetical protein